MTPEEAQELVREASQFGDDDIHSILAESVDAGVLAEAVIALSKIAQSCEYVVQEDVGYWRGRGPWCARIETARTWRDMKQEDAPMRIVRRYTTDWEVVE